MTPKVIVVCAGERQVHAANQNGNYATFCGLDGEENMVQAAGKDDKINCPQCWALWQTAKQYRRSDFVAKR